MKVNSCVMASSNSQPTNPKLVRRLSSSSSVPKQNPYKIHQRRQTLAAVNNEFLTQNISSSLSKPLLIDTINSFFQTTQNMEDEIMLPSRLKDMPIDELVFDNSSQPDNWHELYTFIRDIRNQLQCNHPFAEDNDHNQGDSNDLKNEQRKYSSDDEGILVSPYDKTPFSSTSSVASSDAFEPSSASSIATTSYDTIKDELKYHYYGLIRTLDNLTTISNRVREKYREESNF